MLFTCNFLFSQANGLDERYNQTLQNMFVKYATDNRAEWDNYLDTCVYAYNTSVQESTRFSPFEVMFGRKPTMPIDVDMATNTPEDQLQMYLEAEELSQSQVNEMAAQRQELLQQVKANIKQAQDKQKEYFDWKHTNPAAYSVGAKVLKKDFARSRKEEKWTLDLLGRTSQKMLARVCTPSNWRKILQWLLSELMGLILSLTKPLSRALQVVLKATPPQLATTRAMTVWKKNSLLIAPMAAVHLRGIPLYQLLMIPFHHYHHQCLLLVH